jgi:hypothetical protein
MAVTRKNFLFLGSDSGGDRAAIPYTVIESAKLNDLDPEAYSRQRARSSGAWSFQQPPRGTAALELLTITGSRRLSITITPLIARTAS